MEEYICQYFNDASMDKDKMDWLILELKHIDLAKAKDVCGRISKLYDQVNAAGKNVKWWRGCRSWYESAWMQCSSNTLGRN